MKMENMDLQSRKLHLITFLAQIQDEELIGKIEAYIFKDSQEGMDTVKPFTVEELRERIDKSEDDFRQGRYKTQEEVLKNSVNW